MKFEKLGFSFFAFLLLICLAGAFQDWTEDQNPKKWNDYALNKINEQLNKKINTNIAKNVILFLGDGMGITTITAGRIRKGQLNGKNGEEEITAMER
jgi:alkaline phosphatase